MWFTLVWGYAHQLLRLLYYSSIPYIQLLMCTNLQSQDLNQTRDLCTEHHILLPNLGQMHIAKTLYHSTCTLYRIITTYIRSFAQRNSVHIELDSLFFLAGYFYNTVFFIYILQTLTIGPKHGKIPWAGIP